MRNLKKRLTLLNVNGKGYFIQAYVKKRGNKEITFVKVDDFVSRFGPLSNVRIDGSNVRLTSMNIFQG